MWRGRAEERGGRLEGLLLEMEARMVAESDRADRAEAAAGEERARQAELVPLLDESEARLPQASGGALGG